MSMDLSKLSDADLEALAGGDLTKVSDAGLSMMGGSAPEQPAAGRTAFGAAMGVASPIARGETALSLLTGAVAAPIAGLSGIAQGVTNTLRGGMRNPGEPGMPAGDRTRQVQEALTYQPRTAGGQALTQAIGTPFEKVAEGADWVGQKTADATGSPVLGAAANTALQTVIPAGAGKVLNPLAGRAAVLARERADVARRLNVDRDKAMQLLREEGLTLPVAEANPMLLNRVLEGFSGQAKSQQLNSTKNQPVLNQIVRRGLGIKDDVPLSAEVLETVRKNAGKEYERVKGSGRVTADDTFRGDLEKIKQQFEGLEKDFPEMVNADVKTAVDAARKDSFDASSAVGAIKRQRQLADKEFRGGDPELGKVHKSIADAFEAQLERHLEAMGGEGLEAFRHARQVIAKSYDVQKALKGNDVDTRILSAQLKKKGQTGGDFRAIYEMGERFPNSAQVLNKNTYVPTFFDGAIGAAAAIAGGNPLLLAAAGSRPALRGLIASRPYQSLMTEPSYGGAGIRTMAEALTSDPALAAYLGMQGGVER